MHTLRTNIYIYRNQLKMSELKKEEKVDLIIKEAEKHDITAYEFGTNTEISIFAAERLLKRLTKKPSQKTLNEMLNYIEGKIVGSKIEANEPEISYPKKAKKYSNGVPFFNVDFSSGYDTFYNSQVPNPDFYIDYPPYNHADFWVCNVGNSMSPKIENGDIVALQQKTDLQQMIYGEIYALVLPEMRTIKYIRKSKVDGHIRFVPENMENYDPQDMPLELIQKFFLVLGSIKKFF